jgi:uncharacterized protein involved in exopolysaccharide biosynthesis
MSLNQIINAIFYRKKLLVLIILFITSVSSIVTIFLPKIYVSEALIAIDTAKIDPIRDTQISGQLLPTYIATQTKVFTSLSIAKIVVEITNLAELDEVKQLYDKSENKSVDIKTWMAMNLLNNLDVSSSIQDNIVKVSYSSQDPMFSSLIANAFIKAYKISINNNRNEYAQQNNQFFQVQIKELEKNLRDSQDRLTKYQQEYGVIDIDDRTDSESQKLNAISMQLVNAKDEEISLKSRINSMNNGNDELKNNPTLQQMKNTISELEANTKSLLSRTGINNPEYKKSLAQLQSLKHDLKRSMQDAYIDLENEAKISSLKVNKLELALEEQKKFVLKLKSAHTTLNILQHDVDNAQKVYDSALLKLSTSMLESKIDTNNVIVIQEAIPSSKPAKPKFILNFIFSLFFGVVIGVIFCLLSELLNRKIRDINDLASISNKSKLLAQIK